MTITWDATKAAANLAKHGIAFEEAAEVFRDPLSDRFDDPDHSQEENRYILVGTGGANRLLFVSFAEYGDDEIRIISARNATKSERNLYENEI